MDFLLLKGRFTAIYWKFLKELSAHYTKRTMLSACDCQKKIYFMNGDSYNNTFLSFGILFLWHEYALKHDMHIHGGILDDETMLKYLSPRSTSCLQIILWRGQCIIIASYADVVAKKWSWWYVATHSCFLLAFKIFFGNSTSFKKNPW